MSYKQIEANVDDVATVVGKFLTPFQRKLLQTSLKEDLPKSYYQRIYIMLLADEGKSQKEICSILGCCNSTVRHWMHIARSGMAHQWQDCPIGRPKAVSEEYLERLKELISNSPRDYGYSFQYWTVNWLGKHLAKELGVEVSVGHIKRLLKKMNLSTKPQRNQAKKNQRQQSNSSQILISDLKNKNYKDGRKYLHFSLTNLEKINH